MRFALACLVAAAAGFAPAVSAAHELIPGLTGFPALVLHPVALIDHALALIASGLLAGQAKVGLLTRLAPALVIAMLAGYFFPSTGIVIPFEVLAWLSLVPLALALISGGLAAAAVRPGGPVVLSVAIAVGWLLGYETTPHQSGWGPVIETIAGAMLGALAIMLATAALAAHARRPWQQVGVRVVGSWIAATAVMVFALVAARS